MSERDKDATPLAKLVTAGEGQTEAEAITDSIFMVKDISNAYLVTTDGGDFLVNTGFMGNDDRNTGLFKPHRTGPLTHILITQAHPDHYGAVPGFEENDTEVIVGEGFDETVDFFDRLDGFLRTRSGKLWATISRPDTMPPVPPKITADRFVSDVHKFQVGSRRVEVHKTPGGESLDSVFVWLPDDRTVFTGNLFGPVWLAMPNLVTIRGDKPRLVPAYLKSVEEVRALEPELLITGHGEPVRGADKIRADLDKMHAAVSYIHDETVKGMNEGRTVHELMRSITLPDDLKIGEFHGKTNWVVRAIWEENMGWFKYEQGTAELYGVPEAAVHGDLVELAGADAIAARAQARLDAGEPEEAIRLADVVLHVQPDQQAALGVKKGANEALLAKYGGTNLSETMWLRSEIRDAEALLKEG